MAYSRRGNRCTGFWMVSMAVAVAGAGVASLSSGRERGIAGLALGFVPWEAVVRVARTEVNRTPLAGVFVSDRALMQTTGAARILARLDSGSYGDLIASPWALRADPDALVETIRHYLEHPEGRRELGTHRAVERFEEIVRATSRPS